LIPVAVALSPGGWSGYRGDHPFTDSSSKSIGANVVSWKAVSLRPIPSLLCGVGLLLAFALAPAVIPNPFFRTAMGDLIPLLVIAAACIPAFRNACDSRGHTRLFWSLMAMGLVMWGINQAMWVWIEVVVRKPLPDPFAGDIVLFLHVVPFMAAVALQPHRAEEREGLLPSTLNVLMVVVWWVVVYAFFVFPDEYLITNVPVYTVRWDVLYAIEELMLGGVAAWGFFTSWGAWRELYRNIFLAGSLYAISSQAMNAAIARGTYRTGGIYDLPFLASLLGFLWVAVDGRRRLHETQPHETQLQETQLQETQLQETYLQGTQAVPAIGRASRWVAPQLARLALVSLPVMAYWALFLSHDQPYLSRVRFAVALGGVALLAFVVFLKQHLLDQRLLRLLKHSRRSFDSLQRLQGRVIQQAKLASLGELVALAASELEFPLSAILANSERMAASSNLSREQLSNAQKIGQQARRTRELVGDLLSFAQQTPGEKSPVELKPLLQRAVQMEGFKLENKRISLIVESNSSSSSSSNDALPRVLGNPNQLLQAFLQIVENAVDALQETGGGRLQVCLWREGNEVVVQFADNGPGLRDPERVFDPFYTTKPVGKGTGLGLSATYGVILDHKGQITCYNRPEGGAVFEIRLPVLGTTAPLAEAARG
jgi:signal transduction histidine kinase